GEIGRAPDEVHAGERERDLPAPRPCGRRGGHGRGRRGRRRRGWTFGAGDRLRASHFAEGTGPISPRHSDSCPRTRRRRATLATSFRHGLGRNARGISMFFVLLLLTLGVALATSFTIVM